MKLPRLLTTSAMRLALRFSLFYAALLIIIGLAFLWSTSGSIDNEISEALAQEYHTLLAVDQNLKTVPLIDAIEERQKKSELFYYLLLDNEGQKLAGNILHTPDNFDPDELPVDPSHVFFTQEILPRDAFDDDVFLPTLQRELRNGKVLIISHASTQADLLLMLGEYLLEFAGMAILLSLLIGFSLGYAILRRIDTINNTADEIMKGDITQRIPLTGKHDEFDVLSTHLNSMMDRIQKLIESIREVSDNVAHDLRSPLTRLRNNLEVTLLEPRSDREYKAALESSVEDIESLLHTFNSLLSIAQAESGNHRSQWKMVNLNELLSNVVELYTPVAEAKNQKLTLSKHDECSLKGSRDLLAQAFSNIIENALKYTPEFGLVGVSVRCNENEDTIEINFKDSGSGIPANEREHVLERFVRLDNSRNSPGNGLGLSLVNAVCELHQGSLHLRDAKPGLLVTLRFPYAKPS